jgi:serine/threonine protein kinase
VTERFDHPNVVRSLGRGETVKSKFPYFVMPYYELGTLEGNYQALGSPIERLRLFLAICEGVAYAHRCGLLHRDLKPSNIFLAECGVPIVGDFGLCYRADEDRDGRNTQTSEAVGARKYMPPEWREGKAEKPNARGDIYSLGKILYWLFQGRVYDGHEDDHSLEHPVVKTTTVLQDQTPQRPQQWTLAYSVVDELVSRTVLKKPESRIDNVANLIGEITAAIERVESLGRVLDFNLPKRCLFCAAGTYQLAPDLPFPLRNNRRNPTGDNPLLALSIFVKGRIGVGIQGSNLIPIYLTCDVCGNIQYFRLDLTTDRSGQKLNP